MANQKSEKPIFVIGAERSGTTLVMAMLGAHPRIAVPEVAWYYPRFYPYLYTYGNLNEKHNFEILISEMIFGLKTPFWNMQINPRTIVNELYEKIDRSTFGGIYDAILTMFSKSQNKPRWGEKTPYNLFFIEAIINDFPDAQIIFVTRDGRDASADYLESSFGPTNIYCAAEIWKLCQNTVSPWRKKLSNEQWMDVKYEELVKRPKDVLQKICDFLNEKYSPVMLNFYNSDIARARGATRDHKPLGSPVSDKYIGIYKYLMSQRDQEIFNGVAHNELVESGYESDVKTLILDEETKEIYRDKDGRIRAATLDGTEGHIVYESYNDWLEDQREIRKQNGVWTAEPENMPFPIGSPHEELITGQRAWRYWKKYFCIKRQYEGKLAL